MQILNSLIFATLVLSSFTTHASGQTTHDSGRGMVCFKSQSDLSIVQSHQNQIPNELISHIRSITTHELFEMESSMSASNLILPNQGELPANYTLRILGRIKTELPNLYAAWMVSHRQIFANGNHLFFYENDLNSNSNSNEPIYINHECMIASITRQTDFDDYSKIEIDNRLFSHPTHSLESRGILFLHEVIDRWTQFHGIKDPIFASELTEALIQKDLTLEHLIERVRPILQNGGYHQYLITAAQKYHDQHGKGVLCYQREYELNRLATQWDSYIYYDTFPLGNCGTQNGLMLIQNRYFLDQSETSYFYRNVEANLNLKLAEIRNRSPNDVGEFWINDQFASAILKQFSQWKEDLTKLNSPIALNRIQSFNECAIASQLGNSVFTEDLGDSINLNAAGITYLPSRIRMNQSLIGVVSDCTLLHHYQDLRTQHAQNLASFKSDQASLLNDAEATRQALRFALFSKRAELKEKLIQIMNQLSDISARLSEEQLMITNLPQLLKKDQDSLIAYRANLESFKNKIARVYEAEFQNYARWLQLKQINPQQVCKHLYSFEELIYGNSQRDCKSIPTQDLPRYEY